MRKYATFYWLLALLAGATPHAQAASYVWNGSSGPAWDMPANWSPVGVPGAADEVTIGAVANAPRLAANRSLASLTMGGGSLDLGGFTLTVTGNATLEGGNPRNGQLILNGPSVRFGPCSSLTTTGPILDAVVSVNTTTLSTHGTTFNQAVTLTAVQSGECSQGGNRFNAPLSLVYSGSGMSYLGNDQEKSIFNADLTLTNAGSGFIAVNWNEFNGNVRLNSSGGDIRFGYANTYSQMAAGKSLSVGSFPAGVLKIFNFTQLGNAPQTLALTGSAYLWVQNSVFNGPVAWVAPNFNLIASTFNQTVALEKTGGGYDGTWGGNVFQGTVSVINSGSGNFSLPYSFEDTFHGDVTLTNAGTGAIYPAHSGANTRFNGNLILNCTNGQGIIFSGNGGTSSLAVGKTLRIGSAGFSTGRLVLDGLTQRGNIPQNLTLTGGAALWIGSVYGTRSEFEGPVNFKAPGLMLNGAIYRSDATFEVTAVNWQGCHGGNEFYGRTQITNSGTDVFMLAANNTGSNKEVFNGELTLSNTGTGYILFGGGKTYEFNGDLVVNSTGGSGFRFEGSSRLAAGKTLRVGSLGFSAGDLWMYGFTQLGSTPQNLTMSGSTRLYLSGCRFGGPVRFSAPSLFVDYNVFEAESEFTRTATAYSAWQGGNVFTRKMRFINQSGWEMHLSSSADNVLVK